MAVSPAGGGGISLPVLHVEIRWLSRSLLGLATKEQRPNLHFPILARGVRARPARTEAENIELLKQYIRDKEATVHFQFGKDKVLDEVLLKNGFILDYTLTPQPDFKQNEVLLARRAQGKPRLPRREA